MIRRRCRSILLTAALPILALSLLLGALTARAAPTQVPQETLVVTSLLDSGPGTLRDTIAAATDGDTITFDPALEGVKIILLSQIEVGKDLTIRASFPITISGGNLVRLFEVTAGQVAFDGLTLAEGAATPTDCGGVVRSCGGAIFVRAAASVVITESTISENTGDSDGGAIANAGVIAISNSVLSENLSGFAGGAIANIGVVTITDSTFSENSSRHAGGAIANGGTISIARSTFSENAVTGPGGVGGAFANANTGAATVVNSTLSGNSADYGGAVHNVNDATIVHSTLTANSAASDGGGITSMAALSADTTISHTIVSGNIISGTGTADDLALYAGSTDSFASGGYNLVGTIDPAITAFSAPGDQVGVNNPNLGTLQDNGGPTETHLPAATSPVVDAGAGTACAATDQRGVPRPQGTNCDIGAVEVQQTIGSLSLTISTVTTTTAELTWPEPNPGCEVAVYEDTVPYFNTGVQLSADASSPFLRPDRLGDPATNYYYRAQLTCDLSSAMSNRVGEFDFALIPGQ